MSSGARVSFPGVPLKDVGGSGRRRFLKRTLSSVDLLNMVLNMFYRRDIGMTREDRLTSP